MTLKRVLLWVGLAAAGLAVSGTLGQILLYPWLGLFPGLALASWLLPRDGLAIRATVGICVSPLLATVAAWLLMRAGVGLAPAAWAVGVAGAIGCAAAAWLRPHAADAAPEGVPRAALAWALALAAVLLAVPLLNPYILVRSDAWIHGGIVMELMERGFPPEDARMAGLRLNYVWFFNFFIALLSGMREQDPFRFMTLFNVANGFATVVMAALIARRLWGGTRAPLAAAALITLGLNAGAFLLWPLHLLKAMSGEVRGWPEVVRQVQDIGFGTARILYHLSAPYAEMVSFLDKFLIGTALSYGYLQMSLMLWALLAWLGDGRRSALLWLALAATAMMLFHSVVGLSVVPVALAVTGLAWLLRGRWSGPPSRGALAAAAAAMLAGALVTVPYTRSITSGWSAEQAGFEHRFLGFSPGLLWTVLTACAFALILLPGPLARAWRERRPLPLLIAGFAAGMGLFACVVQLPERNAVKFVFEFFTPCAVLAAPALAETAERLWRTRRGLALALALLFVVPGALTVHGYVVDPARDTFPALHPTAGEERLYAWIREETPVDAVLVDRGSRDLIAVRGRRRLFLGTTSPPERAAFPAPEMRRRQRVMSDLFGPMAAPESTLTGLRVLGRPVYVVYRPEDPPRIPDPWQRLLEAAPGSSLAHDRDGYRVVRVAAAGAP